MEDPVTALPTNDSLQAFDERTWREVAAAMDRTYSELVHYQERPEAQNRELDEMRQVTGSVLSTISELLIVVEGSPCIARAGGDMAAILGRDAAPPVGTPLAALLAGGADAALTVAIGDVTRDRGPRVVEEAGATADGPAPSDVGVSPHFDQRRRSRGVVLLGRPTSDSRNAYRELEASHAALQNARSQLVQHEKLAALGRRVAGVAHELNNPISVVYANTHALEKYIRRLQTCFEAVQPGKSRDELVAPRDELRLDRTVENLRGASDRAERLRDIVEDLRRLSAEGTGETICFDMVKTASSAADPVARGTTTPVRIAMSGAEEAVAKGNPGHVRQIVMNLLQNAIDALEATPGSKVTLNVLRRGDQVVVHHACPRTEFHECKASAEKPAQSACMMAHLGCVGTQAVGDCNIDVWKGGGSFTRAGHACINCTAPEFEAPGHALSRTPKIGGIPVGLPSDMPKAWFMALASLSKAATPRRLSDNAVADPVETAPTLGTKGK
jgi:two-component system sensor histidine kinase HupT/HoxJ